MQVRTYLNTEAPYERNLLHLIFPCCYALVTVTLITGVSHLLLLVDCERLGLHTKQLIRKIDKSRTFITILYQNRGM